MTQFTSTATTGSSSSDPAFRFSEIAAVLQGTLTGAQINDLLFNLLSTASTTIQAGDLITAEWAMGLVRRIERLELKPDAGLRSDAPDMLVCLKDTNIFYNTLLLNATFIPTDASGIPVKAVMQATGALQRIVNTSLFGAAVVNFASNDERLEIFASLYKTQSDLASLLASQVLGSVDAAARATFAAMLKGQLDSDAGSTLSLKTALTQGKLDAAVLAQNRINGLVMNHGGDATIGGPQILYVGSNGQGRVLKLHDTNPIQYTFQVFNKTNKTSDMQVHAAFRKPHEDWTTSVAISGPSEFKAVAPFDPSKPTDARAFRMVDVLVTTPPNASLNQSGTLDLIVDLPAPISVTNSGSVDLSIGTARVPEGAAWIIFTGEPAPTPETENPTIELQQTSYTFAYQFHGADSTVTRKFKVVIDVTSAGEDQLFQFDISQTSTGGAAPVIDPPASTLRAKYTSQAFDVASDDARNFNVDVWPLPGSQGHTLTYAVSIVSVDGVLQTAAPKSISISVQ